MVGLIEYGAPDEVKQTEPLVIVIDHHEIRSQLPALVERLWQPVVVRRLPIGDVHMGRVLVERKEAHDFVQSLHSGRLFRQAYKLKGASHRPLVILEGDPYRLVSSEQLPALRGAVLSLLVGYGIPVLRTRDVEGTAESLVRIARQESRRSQRRGKTREIARRASGGQPPAKAPSPTAQTLAILEALPDVGPMRAQALLQHFGSLQAILSSDPAELVKTHGIGPTTATRILSSLLRTVHALASPAAETRSTNVGEATESNPSA
ncbi:MAG: hypothetical protein JKY65_10500 [Planctomycetes bacterium]|nr:hypothetical protein [Planctomycetota bacterium]